MQFTHLTGGRADGRTAKFAVVAALHVALGIVFVHGISTKRISLPGLPDPVVVTLDQADPPEPVPPAPPKPMPQVAPPDLVVPKVEVDVAPPPLPTPLTATTHTEFDPGPAPFPDALPDIVREAPAEPKTLPGRMHTAVFADANACALPDYPAAAARRGDSGTTTLALLVGADGRVSSARIEHSSGSRDLDRAAVNALSLCRFKPATENGVAQAGWAQLAYVWKLD